MEIAFILLIILAVLAEIAIFVTAIVMFVKFSSQSPKMLSTVKRAAFWSPLGFGWLIGLILYLTSIKKSVENDPEASKAVSKSFISGILTSIGAGVLISVVFFMIAIAAGVSQYKEDSTRRESSAPSIIAPEVKKSAEYHNYESTDGIFSAELPCANPTKQNIAEENATGYNLICVTKGGGAITVGLAGNENFDQLEGSPLLDQVLDGAIEGVSQSSPQFSSLKIASQNSNTFKGNASREVVFQSEDGSKNAYYRAFFAKTSDGLKLFQVIGYSPLSISKDSTFEAYNKILDTIEIK